MQVIYDGDCPFCTQFVKLYRVRQHVGKVELINARERPDLVSEFHGRGMDINDGMVVRWQGRDYYGPDSLNILAMLGADEGLFAALNRLLFKNKRLARVVYPWLVRGRKLALRLMGRKLIQTP